METWPPQLSQGSEYLPNNEIHVGSEILLYLTHVQSPVVPSPHSHTLGKIYEPNIPIY